MRPLRGVTITGHSRLRLPGSPAVMIAQQRVWAHSPWNSPGQNTGVGSLSLLQGIFPTQRLTCALCSSISRCQQPTSQSMVFPVVMYGCESWTVKKAERWRIDAFELWCWRRLLGLETPAGLCGRCTGVSVPLRVVPSPTGSMVPCPHRTPTGLGAPTEVLWTDGVAWGGSGWEDSAQR